MFLDSLNQCDRGYAQYELETSPDLIIVAVILTKYKFPILTLLTMDDKQNKLLYVIDNNRLMASHD